MNHLKCHCQLNLEGKLPTLLILPGGLSGDVLGWSRTLLKYGSLQATDSLKYCTSDFKLTGEVTPKPQPQRPNKRKLDDHHELLIIGIILDNPCVYLREICICAIIKDATGVVVSGPTVCRIIRKNLWNDKEEGTACS